MNQSRTALTARFRKGNQQLRSRAQSLWLARVSGTVCCAFFLAGCGPFMGGTTITGSGKTIAKQYSFTNFSGVSAGSAFHVVISQGASPGVAVTVDDNIAEFLDVTEAGGQLRLYLKSNVSVRDATLRAAVTLPELTALELSGAARAEVEACRTAKALSIDMSGASRLGGDVQSGDAHLALSGASRTELKGSAGNLRLTASGASHADLEQFSIKDAVVDADGASHVVIKPSGRLEARASGASSIRYAGQPANVDARSSGASSVKPK